MLAVAWSMKPCQLSGAGWGLSSRDKLPRWPRQPCGDQAPISGTGVVAEQQPSFGILR